MTDMRMMFAAGRSLGLAGYRRAFAKQIEVIGALMMRELHTRYGRDNVGYLWLILDPMLLGSVIGLLHSAGHHYGAGIPPVAFAVVGYCNFIMFRGIVNRSEGTIESNAPLLYHRQVTIIDIVVAKALLEGAGTFCSFLTLFSLLVTIGIADLPSRPLYMFAGIGYILWFSTAISMIVVGGTHEIRSLERLVHVFTYFSIPVSGAFFVMSWLPEPYKTWLTWIPFPSMFEMIRYGAFENASSKYIFVPYMTGCCMVLTLLGLIAIKGVRRRVHLR